MKNFLHLRGILTAIIAFMALNIFPAPKYTSLPEYLDGSMMPINFSFADSTACWGDSLKPVYAGYLARHGARFLSSAEKVTKLQNILLEKVKTRSLTTDGEAFFSILSHTSEATGGKWGALSPVGIMEQHRLAAQTNSLIPELLHKGDLYARGSYVPRVVMTMYQFCHSLGRMNPSLEMDAASGKRFNDLVRFFTTDSTYRQFRKNGDWKAVYEDYVARNVPVEPALRLIGSSGNVSSDSLRKITMMEYAVLQGLRAAGLPAPTTRFMSENEYRACWKASNLEHYLRNSINPLSNSAAAAASSLLMTIIADADDYLKYRSDSENDSRESSPVPFNLYFGHAETLMPAFSLMDLPGCKAMPDDYETLDEVWKDYDIVPLGANLLIVILQSDSGKLYAATRLNCKFIAPIEGMGKVVEWNRLRSFWLSQIPGHN